MANLKIRTNTPKSPPRKNKHHSKGKKLNKFKLKVIRDQFVSKNGKIRKKTKENLKLLDEILKTELGLIGNGKNKHKNAPVHGVNNNIYQVISEQETAESSQKSDKNNKTNANTTDETKVVKQIPDPISIEDSPKKSPQTKPKSSKSPLSTGDESNKEKAPKKSKNTKKKFMYGEIPKPFQCDLCQKSYPSKPMLRRHIHLHLNLKPHVCHHCRRRFRKHCNLHVHIVSKHIELTDNPEKYICDLCNKSFLIKENLSLHLTHHTKGVGFYKCAFCDKKFSNHFHLTEHEKHHLKTSRYQCSICNMRYKYRSKLALHVKSHLNIKDFVCQYCGKEFLRPTSIRRHVEICHSGFRIQCPICHKKLKGHLSEHLRTHENSRPHKCPDCGQRFTQSTHLTVHRRSHTGAKPYSCRICGQRFTHSNAMLLHFRRHTGEKPFQCAMCPLWFSQLPHMKAHMKTIHGKTEAYLCQKCKQFFKLKKQLEKHSRTCMVGEELSPKEKMELPIQAPEIDSIMSLSRMRFLLALLLTMVASKGKLKALGFNKRLVDNLLEDSLEAMGHEPCRDDTLSPLKRLKANIDLLLTGTIPEDQMKKFQEENKTTEELLELLTDDKTSCKLSGL